MIHKVKSLYDNGNGLTERKIAKELGLSRNTVSKYLRIPETEMARQLDEIARTKKLDAYRAFIIQLLQTYPNLSAVKVMRKLKVKIDALTVSERSMRRYIQALKDEISFKQPRYYEPVIDMVPGAQCQVDGDDVTILEQRKRLYEEAKKKHPERWSGEARNWLHESTVRLNSGNEQPPETVMKKVA